MKLTDLNLSVDVLDLATGQATVGGVLFQVMPGQDEAVRSLISSQLGSASMAVQPAQKPAKAKAAPKAKDEPVEAAGRVRRTAEQIDELAERIVAHVVANPGARAEDIRAALSIPKNEWTLTIQRPIEAGKLRTTGEKRATQYFAKGSRGKK